MNHKEKEIIFDHMPSQEEISDSLFSLSSDDPRALSYKRKLAYHKINWLLVISNILWSSGLIIGSCLLLHYLIGNIYLTIFIPIGIFILLNLIFIKPITIFLIKLYQHVAPKSLRNKCRFEPSCSEYMLLAIQKYGFIKGVIKGIDRLKRCCPPYGGYDYP